MACRTEPYRERFSPVLLVRSLDRSCPVFGRGSSAGSFGSPETRDWPRSEKSCAQWSSVDLQRTSAVQPSDRHCLRENRKHVPLLRGSLPVVCAVIRKYEQCVQTEGHRLIWQTPHYRRSRGVPSQVPQV